MRNRATKDDKSSIRDSNVNEKEIIFDYETDNGDDNPSNYCSRDVSYKELQNCDGHDLQDNEDEDNTYEFKIGFVSPNVRAMILEAQFENRFRKVPEEHKTKYAPSVFEAALIGRATRLNEQSLEKFGMKHEKYKSTELPSDVWSKGKEYFTVHDVIDRSSDDPVMFKIFNEAVALGGIKALKPKITTNYDQLLTAMSTHGDDVDVDDINKHKLIRTRYLTDLYIHREFREDDEYLAEKAQVNYQSLDDVILPTEECPTFIPSKPKMTHLKLKEAIAQEVAEKVWERRYRLERPRAQQRIKSYCICQHCQTSNPYQTFAYRKKWLRQKGLWNGPKKETIAEDNQSTQGTNNPGANDAISSDRLDFNTEINSTSFDTTDLDSFYNEGDKPFDVYELDFVQDMEIIQHNDIKKCENQRYFELSAIVDTDQVSGAINDEIPQDVAATAYSSPPISSKKKKRKEKKPFIVEIKNVLGLSQHIVHSSGFRARQLRKAMSQSNGKHLLFGFSSHHKKKKKKFDGTF